MIDAKTTMIFRGVMISTWLWIHIEVGTSAPVLKGDTISNRGSISADDRDIRLKQPGPISDRCTIESYWKSKLSIHTVIMNNTNLSLSYKE